MASAAQQGAHRQFSAFARPRGDAALGIAGPVVEIHERAVNAGRGVRKLRAVWVLSHAEAPQLHHELGEALRSFAVANALLLEPGDLAKQMAGVVAAEIGEHPRASSSEAVGPQEHPRAYGGPWPIRDHGTLADHGFIDQSGERAA